MELYIGIYLVFTNVLEMHVVSIILNFPEDVKSTLPPYTEI